MKAGRIKKVTTLILTAAMVFNMAAVSSFADEGEVDGENALNDTGMKLGELFAVQTRQEGNDNRQSDPRRKRQAEKEYRVQYV